MSATIIPVPYIQFGSALIYCNPNNGNQAVNPTGVRGLVIQNLEIDQAADTKELRGQNQFPEDTARSDIKSTFKFSIGKTDFWFLTQTVWADVFAAGGVSVVVNQANSVPGSVAYTVTPTLPTPASGTATFLEDLGVQYASGGNFQNLGSGSVTAAGQYTVNTTTGVYTFDSADASASVVISFAYTLSAVGSTFQINNHVQGYSPQFEMFAVETYSGASASGTGASKNIPSTARLYACKIGKVTFPYKRNDYKMVDVEGMYFASSTGRVVDYYAAQG